MDWMRPTFHQVIEWNIMETYLTNETSIRNIGSLNHEKFNFGLRQTKILC